MTGMPKEPAAKPQDTDQALLWTAYEKETFPSLHLARVARAIRRLGVSLLVVLMFTLLAMLFAPWQQSIRGEGTVIAFNPAERPQSVEAPVKGRLAMFGEGIQENAFVKKGQLLFRIEDQDPLYLNRLGQQVTNAQAALTVAESQLKSARTLRDNNLRIVEFATEELENLRTARDEVVASYDLLIEQANNEVLAKQSALTAAEAKRWQAEADYERQKQLFSEGIKSELKAQEAEQKFRDAEAYVLVAEQEVAGKLNGVGAKQREREAKLQEWQAKIAKVQSQLEKARADVAKAEIDIDKTTGDIADKRTKLLDQQRKLAVQETQDVLAPSDGWVMNIAVLETSSIVKPGDKLCWFVPKTERPAVQVWVSGNDAPLIEPGRHVRLQFEGWPAVQFAGWPSVAVGTFGGTVSLIDSTTENGQGKFRVVIEPDPDDISWPEYPYLRQGVRSYGWVLLDQVPLGYEVWRRMNGFPPSLDTKKEEKTRKPPKIKI